MSTLFWIQHFVVALAARLLLFLMWLVTVVVIKPHKCCLGYIRKVLLLPGSIIVSG